MVEKMFKTIKEALLQCSKLPKRIKDILNTVNNSLKDLDKVDSKDLWILLHDFVKETSVLEDATDKELLECYQCILNIIQHAIKCEEDIICDDDEYLPKTIIIFQTFYSKNFKYKFKLEVVKMCLNFWKLVTTPQIQNEPEKSLDFDTVLTQSFVFTFNYLFDTIKITSKKNDMKTLSSLLWEFCKIVTSLTSNEHLMNLIIINLEKNMNHSLFLETETGKLIIADIFTISQQLFLRFHQTIKKNLPKANKLEAEAYGEIYFIAWINSNASMREVIEQQGIFDLLSKTFLLQRTGLAFRTYRNALVLLQSMQNHRKHLLFSKVITKLYAPILWRHLMSEFRVVRCNASEILARAYPLEKRGEGREVSSRFLIKQQNAFLDLMEDPCPQVRIAAIKGICSCMRYFWDSFEDDQIHRCFILFTRLIDESVFEVRRIVYYGLCQLLEESRSHGYFTTPLIIAKMKNTLKDDNEKVRRAFIHLLLKIKKIDQQSENVDKLNFAKIVNLNNIASALANEDKQNGLLLVDLIFDNFIGNKVPDRHTTLMRFKMFYKINPTAFRKLMIYSEKHLNFNDACQLILSLLKTVYNVIKKKEESLKNINKENHIPSKKRKIDDNLDTSHSSCSSSISRSNEENEDNEQANICCILDCVYCLMIVHRFKFIEENNQLQMKEIQDSCTSCLIKLLKFYKEGDAYFSALNLASLIPVSKLTPHISAPSTALSTLKQLPYDVKNAEEEIDIRKVDCLVYTLCMWKRGYEILQFVNIWIDEAFRTFDLNETQYPSPIIKEGKRVRFKSNIEECKPMTGVILINSMLTNLQTQKTLMDSDVNKKNIHELILYLERVKPAIENRISSDKMLNNLLSDELIIELFLLNMRLHIFYHSHKENMNVTEIIEYQTSILNWISNNIIIYDLHHKEETTIKFVSKIIEVVNCIILNICLMELVNDTFLDSYFTFCATVLNNHIGLRVLISMLSTLVQVSKYFNYLKYMDNLVNEVSILTNCVCSIVSVLNESKFDEERFKNVIGEPLKFRRELTTLILEINKISVIEFKQIFITLIETVINIIAIPIREINEVDLKEQLSEMSFGAYQLTTVIFNNIQLRKYFSSNAVIIFSSNVYEDDCVLLLSAISFIYTLSFQSKQIKDINLEPVVKLLYDTLMKYDKSISPLGDNCLPKNTIDERDITILETSDFSEGILDFKQKGRNILIATAKQLHITLSE